MVARSTITATALHPTTAQLGAWIDAYVSAFGARWGEAHAARGYLTIAQDGKVVFEKAYAEGGRLHFQPVGQGRSRIFGGDDGALFTNMARPVEIEAEAGDGPTRSVTLTQAGLTFRYARARGHE